MEERKPKGSPTTPAWVKFQPLKIVLGKAEVSNGELNVAFDSDHLTDVEARLRDHMNLIARGSTGDNKMPVTIVYSSELGTWETQLGDVGYKKVATEQDRLRQNKILNGYHVGFSISGECSKKIRTADILPTSLWMISARKTISVKVCDEVSEEMWLTPLQAICEVMDLIMYLSGEGHRVPSVVQRMVDEIHENPPTELQNKMQRQRTVSGVIQQTQPSVDQVIAYVYSSEVTNKQKKKVLETYAELGWCDAFVKFACSVFGIDTAEGSDYEDDLVRRMTTL